MNVTNKKLLALVAVVALVVAGGAFAAVTYFDATGEDVEEGGANAVPEKSTFGMYVDVNGLVTAESSRDVGEYVYEDRDETYEEVINENVSESDEWNFSATDVDYVTAFGVSESFNGTQPKNFENVDFDEEYAGAIVAFEQPLDEQFEDGSDVVGNESDVEETEYNGHTVFIVNSTSNGTEPLYVGVLDRNTIVVGPENVTKDSIDTLNGDNPTVSGDVANALQTEDTVYVSFAFEVSEYDYERAQGEYVNDVELVTGQYETEGNQMNFSASMQFGATDNSTQAAEEIENLIDTFKFFISDEDEAALQEIDKIVVEENEGTVTVEYNTTSDSLIKALKQSENSQ